MASQFWAFRLGVFFRLISLKICLLDWAKKDLLLVVRLFHFGQQVHEGNDIYVLLIRLMLVGVLI